jgi:tRNA A37 methylthiotransferase MiaB
MCDSTAYGALLGVYPGMEATPSFPKEELAGRVISLERTVQELQSVIQHKLDMILVLMRRQSELEEKLSDKADKRRKVPKSTLL